MRKDDMRREIAAAILGTAVATVVLFTFYAAMWAIERMPDFLGILK